MDFGNLALLGRLIFDVIKWSQDDTKEAENNRELNDGHKKHNYVAQGIINKIANYDLRPAFDILDPHAVQAAKEEAIKHVDRQIKNAVDTHNQTGEFVKG